MFQAVFSPENPLPLNNSYKYEVSKKSIQSIRNWKLETAASLQNHTKILTETGMDTVGSQTADTKRVNPPFE